MSYYQLYGHQLPASSMRPPTSSNNSIKSESGVRSPTSRPLGTSQTSKVSYVGNNSTIHPPIDSSTDPANYLPTPNVSSAMDDITFGGYNKEISGICESISRLEMPTVEEERQNVPMGKIEESLPDYPILHPNQRLTPVKFSSPHVKAGFTARGLFTKVDAKSPLDGQSGKTVLTIIRLPLSVWFITSIITS